MTIRVGDNVVVQQNMISRHRPAYAVGQNILVKREKGGTWHTIGIIGGRVNENVICHSVGGEWIAIRGEPTITRWISHTAIVSGLPNIGIEASPMVFNMGGIWYMIAGNRACVFHGFRWTGINWVSDSTIISGLPSITRQNDLNLVVFDMGGIWYMIYDTDPANFSGFRWTGTTWMSYPAIVSGLPHGVTEAYPTVFFMNNIWYLIYGDESGAFVGFRWTGTAWVSDTSIINGLPQMNVPDTETSPRVFLMANIFYMIVGYNDGFFNGFRWTGTAWVSDSVIINGLPAPRVVGLEFSPTIFNMGGIWYLIYGDSAGNFHGFKGIV